MIRNYLKLATVIIGFLVTLISLAVLITNPTTTQPAPLHVVSIIGYAILTGGIIWFAFTKEAADKWRVTGVAILYLITIPFFIWVGTWLATSRDLPMQGQLIIPNSYLFKIPDKMIGTVWYLPSSSTTLEQASTFGTDVASNRTVRYGGRVEDYPTIILMNNKLPLSDKSTCQGFGQGQIGNPGTTVGDNACIIVLEYSFK
jgi:uncharacterized membrane protein